MPTRPAAYIPLLSVESLLPPKMPTKEKMEGVLLELRKRALVDECFLVSRLVPQYMSSLLSHSNRCKTKKRESRNENTISRRDEVGHQETEARSWETTLGSSSKSTVHKYCKGHEAQ